MGTRDALISDRPDYTESAQTIAPKHVQVESGSTYSREGATRSTTIGEVLARAGLTSHLELRVAGNSWASDVTGVDRISGRQDGSLGIKYAISEGPDGPSWTPSLSIIAASSVPTGSAGYRSNRSQPEVKLIGAWTLTDRIGFSSNLNVARPYDGVRSFTEFAGSGSFGYAATDRVAFYAEGFAFAPQDGSHLVNKFVNGGFTFLFNPDVQVDVRGGTGPTVKSGDFFAGVGIVLRR